MKQIIFKHISLILDFRMKVSGETFQRLQVIYTVVA